MPRRFVLCALTGLSLLALMPAIARAENSAALISTFRLAHGEGAVAADPVLTSIARAQAEAMAQKAVMDHDVLGAFSSRVAPAKAGRAAENIAYGYDDFPRTLDQWINSPSHRKNLLLHDAVRVGVASARSGVNRRTYWALVIAGGYEKPSPRQPKVAAKAAGPKPVGSCRVKLLGVCL